MKDIAWPVLRSNGWRASERDTVHTVDLTGPHAQATLHVPGKRISCDWELESDFRRRRAWEHEISGKVSGLSSAHKYTASVQKMTNQITNRLHSAREVGHMGKLRW